MRYCHLLPLFLLLIGCTASPDEKDSQHKPDHSEHIDAHYRIPGVDGGRFPIYLFPDAADGPLPDTIALPLDAQAIAIPTEEVNDVYGWAAGTNDHNRTYGLARIPQPPSIEGYTFTLLARHLQDGRHSKYQVLLAVFDDKTGTVAHAQVYTTQRSREELNLATVRLPREHPGQIELVTLRAPQPKADPLKHFTPRTTTTRFKINDPATVESDEVLSIAEKQTRIDSSAQDYTAFADIFPKAEADIALHELRVSDTPVGLPPQLKLSDGTALEPLQYGLELRRFTPFAWNPKHAHYYPLARLKGASDDQLLVLLEYRPELHEVGAFVLSYTATGFMRDVKPLSFYNFQKARQPVRLSFQPPNIIVRQEAKGAVEAEVVKEFTTDERGRIVSFER